MELRLLWFSSVVVAVATAKGTGTLVKSDMTLNETSLSPCLIGTSETSSTKWPAFLTWVGVLPMRGKTTRHKSGSDEGKKQNTVDWDAVQTSARGKTLWFVI